MNMIYDMCVCARVCQDEVIGVSKKVVVRVEHLVKWTCPEQSQWKHNTVNITDPRVLNGSSCLTDPQEVKTKGEPRGWNSAAPCRIALRRLRNSGTRFGRFFFLSVAA